MGPPPPRKHVSGCMDGQYYCPPEFAVFGQSALALCIVSQLLSCSAALRLRDASGGPGVSERHGNTPAHHTKRGIRAAADAEPKYMASWRTSGLFSRGCSCNTVCSVMALILLPWIGLHRPFVL